MRTTVRIDDDLMRELRQRAHADGISLTECINRVLGDGLGGMQGTSRKPRPFRAKTFRMGEPKSNLDKSLALAASLAGEEAGVEWARRK